MIPTRRTQGLTLIEVLVTSALFALLLGLVSQFFVSQSRAANLQKAQNEANEGTRTALSLIAWDLQNAGYRVVTSLANPAISVVPNTYQDTLTTRYLDEEPSINAAQKVRYDIAQGAGEIVTSLRRARFDDALANPPNGQGLRASVASMVALNVRFETRADQFRAPNVTPSPPLPAVSKSCSAGTTAVPQGALNLSIKNCSVDWVWSDTPLRLVRRAKVQVLGRSETRVSRYDANQTFTFEGGHTYRTEPGYVYHFAEQTVIVPNLGR